MKTFRYLVLLLVCSVSLMTLAQTPKYVKKASKSLLNVLSYDAEGKLLCSTNGFLIGENEVVTDYHSLKGARGVICVDYKGKEYPISRILGASALYDVVRFSITGASKLDPLRVAAASGLKSEEVYIMPYLSKQNMVGESTTIEDASLFADIYYYYTLPVRAQEKYLSCPIMNIEGDVLALLQKPSTAEDTHSYALSVPYAQSLQVTALSANVQDYKDIRIAKALPADASQASSFIYLTGTADTTLFLTYTEDFMRMFPAEATGYTLRADMMAAMGRYDEADALWQQGLDAGAASDEVLYARAKTLYENLAARHDTLPATWTFDETLNTIRAAKEAQPLPLYTSLEAQVLYAQQDYAAAGECFVALNATSMRCAENFLYAAQCRQMLGDTLAVLALQDSAVACFTKPYMPDAAPSLLMRATTLLSLERYNEAVQDLNEYERLQRRNLNANFYYQRHQAEMKCRMYQQALDDIDEACKMEPREPLYLTERAALYYRFGETDEAIKSVRQAIALDDTFADAHRILGVCLRQQGNEAEAKQTLQRAAQLGDEMAARILEQPANP